MTRIAVHSDLHLELQSIPGLWLQNSPDILVLAGDIHKISIVGQLLIDLTRRFPAMEIISVSGNHEYYGCADMLQSERLLKAEISGYDKIHFLQCDAVNIRGINFLGCTGWSEMTSLGIENQPHAMKVVESRINDFKLIGMSNRGFNPADCVALGEKHRTWLDQELLNTGDTPTVVITHFSPGLDFSNDNFPISELSAYFCNDYSALINRYQPKLWLYGHTHFNKDKVVGKTRVLTNQHGYGQECKDYQPNLIIDI